MNYRLVEKNYADGGTSYQVQKQERIDGEWTGVYSAKNIEDAQAVLKERQNRSVFTERVIG